MTGHEEGEAAAGTDATLYDADARALAARARPATRMAHELSKPRNWQDFQRKCVVFYRDELNDPRPVPYGRDGQEQRGIDIIAHRNGEPDHFVGIQCKRIEKPLTKAKIMDHCRAALTVEAGLKEIIFATTAPDDTRPTDDAVAVEKELRDEGHDVRVAYYGWDTLQIRIAMHPSATAVFNPTAYANTLPQAIVGAPATVDLAAQVTQLIGIIQSQGLSLQPVDQASADRTAEDPTLHARIDVFRDLFQKDHQLALAERQLLDLRDKTDFATRPWARFRIETNLASIAMELGREEDAVARFETAYALQPEDANAIANLALAHTIQGRFDEAMALARQALDATPRADAAIAYLLQAAARAGLYLHPDSLVPADLEDNVAAAFDVAEYLRRRGAPNWAERSIALAARHPASDELKRVASLAVLELVVRDQAFLGLRAATRSVSPPTTPKRWPNAILQMATPMSSSR